MDKISKILLGILVPLVIYTTGVIRNAYNQESQKTELENQRQKWINYLIYTNSFPNSRTDAILAGGDYTLDDVRRKVRSIDSSLANLESKKSKAWYSWFKGEEGK